MGPRYNVQSTEGPLRYPTPPELVLLYNAQRGTPVFGGAKIVPDVSTSHQKRASRTPPENLRKTSGKPPENLRIFLDGAPLGWGSSVPPVPLPRFPPPGRRAHVWVSSCILSWAVPRTALLVATAVR